MNFQRCLSLFIKGSPRDQRVIAIDEKVLELKENLINYTNQLQIEVKRQKIEEDLTNASLNYKSLSASLAILEAGLTSTIKNTVDNLSSIYNTLMKETLPNCRVAYIEPENYMPVINNEEYIQASASVPIRLMYYLSLLIYSLTHNGTNFPRLLIIDTPDTHGIDVENYNKCIREIIKVQDNYPDEQFQIILTTGVDKFPVEYTDRVLVPLTEQDKLLKKITTKKIISTVPLNDPIIKD